jgi:RND family efflux transporter MFP subunit
MNSLAPKSPSADAPAARPPAGSSALEGPVFRPNLGRWLILIVVLIVAALLLGLWPRWKDRKELVKETRELAVQTVTVINAKPGQAAAALTLPAEVKAYEEAPIYARANGYVKKWYADIGTRVRAGDPLADIDTPELDQQISQVRAELVQADAALALSKITAARWAELLKTASVSEQENAEKQADLALKEANVDAARANVRRLQDLQSFTHVVAPFAGVLTVRGIDIGDLISSGKELFRLADITKLRVFVRVPQTATPGIVIGLGAELTIPELPARKFAAKVVRTAGAIDANSRTLMTELEVDNSRNEIFAGAYAQVSFDDVKQDPPLVLPSNTLLFRAEGLQVGVVRADGRVELQSIVIGRDFGKTVEIVSGITPLDKIIVNPADSLVTGALVRIATEVAPNAAQTATTAKPQ